MKIQNEIPKDSLTIKQMADLLGVTKGSLQKKLSREPYKTGIDGSLYLVNGTKYIDVHGQEYIKSLYTSTKVTVMTETKTMDKYPVSIDNDVRFEDSPVYRQMVQQLMSKDQQIQQLMELLRNEQEGRKRDVERLTSSSSNESSKKGLWSRIKAAFRGE